MVRNKNMGSVWFVTGSQHLYGDEVLKQVAANSKEIAELLSGKADIVWKEPVKTAEEISGIMKAANADDSCIGLITWMHTFSPSKMWIAGLNIIAKPILHLHTQFNESLPYDTIDMDFMNLNQSAHGDKEHGFIYARMRKRRKVVVGYWKDETVISRINTWISACIGFDESKRLKICRFGDNMRDVAVTEGDKVAAEIKLGWSVNGYGVGDLVQYVNMVEDSETDALVEEYKREYEIVTDNIDAVKEQARYELAIQKFLGERNASAFTTTFEDLNGLKQLPGLACQRLMGKGYGFGAEGDWKISALTRVLKVMASNEKTSFMEDYTYNLEKGNELVLGAHMLEVCPTLSNNEEKIKIDVQPLPIGGKEPPARMIFSGASGAGVYVTLVDLGNRFRILVEEIEGVAFPRKLPKLPVAAALWKLKPNFYDANQAWIIAGGAHHSVISYKLTKEHIIDFAAIAGIECVVIDDKLDMTRFETDLAISDLYYSN